MKPEAKRLRAVTSGGVPTLSLAVSKDAKSGDSSPGDKVQKAKTRRRQSRAHEKASASGPETVESLAAEIDNLRRGLKETVDELRLNLGEDLERLHVELAKLAARAPAAIPAPATQGSERLAVRLARRVPDGMRRRFKQLFSSTPFTKLRASQAAEMLRRSDLFDAEFYRAHAGNIGPADPALHYVTLGERQGIAPSPHFDPGYYGERYPDVVAAGMCLLAHYLQYGKAEGRQPLPAALAGMIDSGAFSPDKETILLVSHEASRTGAPILALSIGERLSEKYNLVTILLRGGGLADSFAQISTRLYCLGDHDRLPIEFKYILKSILDEQKIRYAIVSSIESKDIMPTLGEAFIPTVNLIHEFSTYTRPLKAVRESLGWTTELLFSTNVTAESFRMEHQGLQHRRVHVVPQGRCRQKDDEQIDPEANELEEAKLRQAIRPAKAKESFVVLGAGSVHIRKGVDLFLATAAAAVRHGRGSRDIRFVWIGHGYDPERDTGYSVYLAEQIARSDLADHFVLLDEVRDLEPAYGLVDAFFLSSRLDPLPNVTIEAATRGLPVICFERASGIAEILAGDAVAQTTVIPHLDTSAAAARILELANDAKLCRRVGEATRAVAERAFDMEDYVLRVDEIGALAVETMQQRRTDFETIDASPLFDSEVAMPRRSRRSTREAAISHFLAVWSSARTAPHQLKHLDLRRPCAGFNPQIYAHHHPEIFKTDTNPLADFIRRGEPKGPWLHAVIRPDDPKLARSRQRRLRTAIHGHFHYPELVSDFLGSIGRNASRFDLFLSTDSEEKADTLRRLTAHFRRGRVDVRIVPNRGRDIAPFFSAFGREFAESYDVVGHVHGKRSTGVDEAMGDSWREFLWQHLIGPRHQMMDAILARFAADEKLGLVFPEEPHLCDWDDNLKLAEEIAARAGLDRPLPPFFEFPVGTMFWARPQALAPFLKLEWSWDDYPAEPLPNDGTMLHAIERLLPFAAQKQGYDYATVHVAGVTR